VAAILEEAILEEAILEEAMMGEVMTAVVKTEMREKWRTACQVKLRRWGSWWRRERRRT
jgi:hypothetical protein